MGNRLEDRVKDVVRQVLAVKGQSPDDLPLEAPLYQEGIGLDSLDAAMFSVLLDREFGADPYRAGAFPATLADVVRFFEAASDQG